MSLKRHQALEVIRSFVAAAVAVDTDRSTIPSDGSVVWHDAPQPQDGLDGVIRLSIVSDVGLNVTNEIDYGTQVRTLFRERLITVQVRTETVDAHEQEHTSGDLLQAVVDGIELVSPSDSDVVLLRDQNAQVTAVNYAYQGYMVGAYMVELRFRVGLTLEVSDTASTWIDTARAVGELDAEGDIVTVAIGEAP